MVPRGSGGFVCAAPVQAAEETKIVDLLPQRFNIY